MFERFRRTKPSEPLSEGVALPEGVASPIDLYYAVTNLGAFAVNFGTDVSEQQQVLDERNRHEAEIQYRQLVYPSRVAELIVSDDDREFLAAVKAEDEASSYGVRQLTIAHARKSAADFGKSRAFECTIDDLELTPVEEDVAAYGLIRAIKLYYKDYTDRPSEFALKSLRMMFTLDPSGAQEPKKYDTYMFIERDRQYQAIGNRHFFPANRDLTDDEWDEYSNNDMSRIRVAVLDQLADVVAERSL